VTGRTNRRINRHALITLLVFVMLIGLMYAVGEARTAKTIAQKIIEAVAAATADLFFAMMGEG
jgi:hypothetical protein